MAEKQFARGLNPHFVEALNKEYGEQDGWWSTLINDKDLFIGIRENKINIYFNGGSILELSHHRTKGFSGQVHFKYLLNLTRENNSRDYVKFENGMFDRVSISDSYRDLVEDIRKIKDAAKRYQGNEKTGVHQIAIRNKNVIDVEIQFPRARGRIDFAALQRINGEIKIVFFEAKTYSNGELRGREQPRVLDQIEQYDNILLDRRAEIESSYAQVARNIVAMSGWNQRRDKVFVEAAEGNLSVDPRVRLAIFGFDEAQKIAASDSTGMFKRLGKALGEDRVIAIGNPHDFRAGIRSPQ